MESGINCCIFEPCFMAPKFLIDKYHFKSDSIFKELPEKDIQLLYDRMLERRYKKGQRVFLEGSQPTGIYYVKNGKIKKYKADLNGREHIIYICTEGDLFGYPALLSEDPYTHSTAAMEDSVIGFVPKNDFLNILHQSTSLSGKLLKNLSHEFGVLVNGISTFAHRTVRERLALCLLILGDKYKTGNEVDQPTVINLKREDLANMVGTAVETLVRLIHDFKIEGLIETKGRKITILDAEKIEGIVNNY